jgi:hypothetical protein
MPATDRRLRPLYPVEQMATWELAEYASDLEEALALDTLPPLYAPREVLQARLFNQKAASGPYGCQRCKPVVAGGRILHGRSRGLLDKVNL